MPLTTTIVVGDGNIERRRALPEALRQKADVRICEDVAALLRTVLDTTPPVIVIGDLGNGPIETLEAAHLVKDIHPAGKVIIIADFSSEAVAIGALRAGVFEYLKAPVTPLEIAEAVTRAMPPPETAPDGFESLVGASDHMRQIKGLIQRIAPLNCTVLITGESGTGKEIVARLVHQHSLRARSALVSVNCAGIPDTLIESELFGHERGAFTGAVARQNGQMRNADRGTLFLDEIGDMSPLAQSKILRALEQREIQPLGSSVPVRVDIRLLAATHRDLDALVAEDRFRSDLYYRLDVTRIHLPPLREHLGDVPALAAHFIREVNRSSAHRIEGFTPAALDRLANFHWPGNVRQFRNVIEAAAAACQSDRISEHDLRVLRSSSTPSALPLRITSASSIPITRLRTEKDALLHALESTQWNMTKTAELLSWSRSTLYRQVAKYKIRRYEGLVNSESAD